MLCSSVMLKRGPTTSIFLGGADPCSQAMGVLWLLFLKIIWYCGLGSGPLCGPSIAILCLHTPQVAYVLPCTLYGPDSSGSCPWAAAESASPVLIPSSVLPSGSAPPSTLSVSPIQKRFILPFQQQGLRKHRMAQSARPKTHRRWTCLPFLEVRNPYFSNAEASFLSDESIATENKAQMNFPAGHPALSHVLNKSHSKHSIYVCRVHRILTLWKK